MENQTVLFHSTIFGPIHSRRLGVSLGINLMPNDGKVCSFDCLYCEAGYNSQGKGTTGLPTVEKVRNDLEKVLSKMKEEEKSLDVITFSGNGEPTLHPQFDEIVDIVNSLRDRYYPQAKVSVLTNSTRIFDPKIAEALKRVDNNILKLDSAIEPTMRMIDRPVQESFTAERVIEGLKQFQGTGIIQTMFLRGFHKGKKIDNTTDNEVEALIEAYKKIRPKSVMIYSLDRSTPEEKLVKVDKDELTGIAEKIKSAGIQVTI